MGQGSAPKTTISLRPKPKTLANNHPGDGTTEKLNSNRFGVHLVYEFD